MATRMKIKVSEACLTDCRFIEKKFCKFFNNKLTQRKGKIIKCVKCKEKLKSLISINKKYQGRSYLGKDDNIYKVDKVALTDENKVSVVYFDGYNNYYVKPFIDFMFMTKFWREIFNKE